MLPRLLLIAFLSVSLTAFAQKGAGSSGGSAPSGSASGTTGAAGAPVLPTTQQTTGGLSGQQAQTPGLSNPSQLQTGTPTIPETMGGPAGNSGTTQPNPANLNNTTGSGGSVGGVVGGGVLLSTPQATFDSPQPTAGISDAGRAGISDNSTINTGLAASLNSSTVVYSSVPTTNTVTENPATAAVSARGPANDLGPSFYSDTVGAAPVNGPSVAEVAAQYKTQQNAQGVKTYTNADIPPQSSGSMNSPMMASNAQPPLPGSSASARSGAAEPPQTQANSGTQQQTAQQTNDNGTTPQVNQPQSQPTQSQRSPSQQSQNENQSLPSTSTFLPLLGLLGIATSGLGIWYRKHRK